MCAGCLLTAGNPFCSAWPLFRKEILKGKDTHFNRFLQRLNRRIQTVFKIFDDVPDLAAKNKP